MMEPKSSREQFGAHADKYAASEIHRAGPSLPVLLEYAESAKSDRVLDIATGAGAAALALAPHAGAVTGVDVSPEMLAVARGLARAESVANVTFVAGAAEALPFAAGAFTLVTSRHAPHHFTDVTGFLREARRVLCPGGRLIMVDQITPAAPGTDETAARAWIERWQRLRDPSHVSQRTIAEWQRLAGETGWQWVRDTVVPYRLDFDWWVRQAGCDEATVQLLRDHARQAPPGIGELFGIEFDDHGNPRAHREPMLAVRLERD